LERDAKTKRPRDSEAVDVFIGRLWRRTPERTRNVRQRVWVERRGIQAKREKTVGTERVRSEESS
jgi:hypothetical protein